MINHICTMLDGLEYQTFGIINQNRRTMEHTNVPFTIIYCALSFPRKYS